MTYRTRITRCYKHDSEEPQERQLTVPQHVLVLQLDGAADHTEKKKKII